MIATAQIMPTRWIVGMLTFFAASAVVALAVAIFAPIPSIRFFGCIALVGALVGTALYLYLLREADPHRWMTLRSRLVSLARRGDARWRRALPRDALVEVQP